MVDKVKKELTAKEIERQQKKIAKDLRKKQYSDIAIQGTNDYSIVSKRSVEKLYTANFNKEQYGYETPQYFQNFVKKFQRRSPAINRGYWVRMEAIKQSSYRIIQDSVARGKKVAIINLGAGYDPLAFQYLDPANPENGGYKNMLSFIDVDYPDLNKIKIEMINNSKQLTKIIGEKQKSDFQGVDLKTQNYVALSCDLKNLDLFESQLEYLDLNNEDITKIFIAEVSIAYMAPDFADPVIKATSKFPNSHFLLLEQLLPSGEYQAFARTMLFHFAKLNSPLKSVTTYPTIDKQSERFRTNGYRATVESLDLASFWNLLHKDLRARVDGAEAFDELEEFILFAQHYLILHASNVSFSLFPEIADYQLDKYNVEEQQFHLKARTEQLERKYLSGTVHHGEIVVNGGAHTSRLNTTMSTNDLSIRKHDLPARQAHTICSTGEGLLLIGGRSSPNKPLSDVWLLKTTDPRSSEWTRLDDMPSSRSRHSSFTHGEDVFVFGGNFDEGPFLRYRHKKWEPVTQTGPLQSLNSAAVAVKGSRGIIIGGMTSQGEIQGSVFSFEITESSINTELLFEDPLLNRYSAKATFISDDEVLVFGGVNDLFLLDQTTTVVKIKLKTREVSRIRVDDNIWKKMPLLIGFELLKYKEKVVTIGGGGVCYSFGSVWNDLLVLGDNNVLPDLTLENTNHQ